MANIKLVYTESFVAEASLATKQYYGVKLTGNRQVNIFTANTDIPCGVLQNAPGSGEEAEVLVIGRTPVKLSDTLVAGEPIYFHSDGTAKKWTPGTDITKYCAGYITIGGSTGELAEAMIQCANPVKGAASA